MPRPKPRPLDGVAITDTVEQWQDELSRKFQLPFEIPTNDKLEAARTGNWFLENDLAIARLDKLSYNEDVQAKLAAPDCRYDLSWPELVRLAQEQASAGQATQGELL